MPKVTKVKNKQINKVRVNKASTVTGKKKKSRAIGGEKYPSGKTSYSTAGLRHLNTHGLPTTGFNAEARMPVAAYHGRGKMAKQMRKKVGSSIQPTKVASALNKIYQ